MQEPVDSPTPEKHASKSGRKPKVAKGSVKTSSKILKGKGPKARLAHVNLIPDPQHPVPEALPKTVPHLRLVASSPRPEGQPVLLPSFEMTPFTAVVQKFKPRSWLMTVEDMSHHIDCELILEVREAGDGEEAAAAVLCRFPNIDDSRLFRFCREDDTLFGILAVRFQMKIMEQLFIFCGEHHADSLILLTDEGQADQLDVYQDFVSSRTEVVTAKGRKVKMVIAAGYGQYDAWVDFMEEMKARFIQNLWGEQRTSPAVKNYLKAHALLDI